jgi:hypothetical protein
MQSLCQCALLQLHDQQVIPLNQTWGVRHLQDSPSVPFRFLNPDIPTLKDEEIKISKQ